MKWNFVNFHNIFVPFFTAIKKTNKKRVTITGARILSFELMNLSYAPEIAQSMLAKQQASARVDAHKLIVNAAMSMTQGAVETLQEMRGASNVGMGRPMSNETVDAITNNLMTVICANKAVTPTLNIAAINNGGKGAGSKEIEGTRSVRDIV